MDHGSTRITQDAVLLWLNHAPPNIPGRPASSLLSACSAGIFLFFNSCTFLPSSPHITLSGESVCFPCLYNGHHACTWCWTGLEMKHHIGLISWFIMYVASTNYEFNKLYYIAQNSLGILATLIEFLAFESSPSEYSDTGKPNPFPFFVASPNNAPLPASCFFRVANFDSRDRDII